MGQTYSELQARIAALQAQATALKHTERTSTIADLKAAIREFGLTPQDLFGRGASQAVAKAPQAGKVAAKYSDGKGNSWTGRGLRPRWLVAALNGGGKLEEFLIVDKAAPASAAASLAATAAGKSRKQRPAAKKRRTNSAKYQDDAGNAWSGMGPKPKWLKDAISAGKRLEDFGS